jgi:hypothetical protein
MQKNNIILLFCIIATQLLSAGQDKPERVYNPASTEKLTEILRHDPFLFVHSSYNEGSPENQKLQEYRSKIMETLKKGADPSACEPPLLQYTVDSDDYELTEAALQYGADLHKKSDYLFDGYTHLFLAKSLKMAQLLIKHGLDPKDYYKGWEYYSCRDCILYRPYMASLDMLAFFFNSGMNPNVEAIHKRPHHLVLLKSPRGEIDFKRIALFAWAGANMNNLNDMQSGRITMAPLGCKPSEPIPGTVVDYHGRDQLNKLGRVRAAVRSVRSKQNAERKKLLEKYIPGFISCNAGCKKITQKYKLKSISCIVDQYAGHIGWGNNCWPAIYAASEPVKVGTKGKAGRQHKVDEKQCVIG